MSRHVLLGIALSVGVVAGCSVSSKTDMAQETCAAFWNYLNANFRPDFYLNQIHLDAAQDSGKLAADALQLSTATTPSEQQIALKSLEGDCDSAGHHYKWPQQ